MQTNLTLDLWRFIADTTRSWGVCVCEFPEMWKLVWRNSQLCGFTLYTDGVAKEKEATSQN